jgi:hypothetical protein
MKHGARSLAEIEKATFASSLRMTDNIHQATKVLDMASVSLSR